MNQLLEYFINSTTFMLIGYDELNFYDVAQYIKLNFDNNTFDICDGANQHATLRISGKFKLLDDEIEFTFDPNMPTEYDDLDSEDLNERGEIVVKKINFKIKKEDVTHFDGYCKSLSIYTIIFDESPFDYKSESLEYPKIFYVNPEPIVCNVAYERLVRDETNLKKFFVNHIMNNRLDILEPNNESVREINLSNPKYIILKFLGEIIVGLKYRNSIIFIVKNEQSEYKYFIPKKDSEQDYILVHSTYYPIYFEELTRPEKTELNEKIKKIMGESFPVEKLEFDF